MSFSNFKNLVNSGMRFGKDAKVVMVWEMSTFNVELIVYSIRSNDVRPHWFNMHVIYLVCPFWEMCWYLNHEKSPVGFNLSIYLYFLVAHCSRILVDKIYNNNNI